MKKFFSLLLAMMLLLTSVSCTTAPREVDSTIIDGENVQLLAAERGSTTVTATDAAYIRSGKYKSTNFKGSDYYYIKNDGVDTTRHILVKFDISDLTIPDGGSVQLVVTFFSISPIHPSNPATEIKLMAYGETSNWDSATVTYDSVPALSESNLVGEEYLIKNDVYINVTDYVDAALEKGEDTISLRLVPSTRTQAEMRVYTLASKFGPRLVTQASAGRAFYQYDLLADKEDNEALWAYGKQVYDAWKTRYDDILAKGDYDAELIEIDKSQYTFTTTAMLQNQGNATYTHDTRLATTLGDFKPGTATPEFDQYGGVISGEQYEATGFFYTKKINDRWFVIDPLGNPCYITGINHLFYAYSNSQYQTNAMLRTYGSGEKWAIASARWLKNDLGINAAFSTDPTVLPVEQGIPVIPDTPGIGDYASSVGLNASTGGTTDFLYNGTMPVFDPAFEEYIAQKMPAAIAKYAESSNILGFISDNELPVADSLLTDYLTLDPSIEANLYSYVCAWTWISEMTGLDGKDIDIIKIDALGDELGVDLRSLFKGHLYDRYFSVIQPAVKASCPNHMYLGIRLLTGTTWGEWVGRFNGYWCDIMCINYYGVWEIEPEQLATFGRWTGKPIMITEFYAKGADAIGADGKPFTNTDGAGWTCATQTERGYFYQNFTLRLLEAKNCIGWLYFQYIDNDPTDETIERGQKNSNKGIVNSDLDQEVYEAFHSQIALINQNKYALIEYFDSIDYFR